MKKKVFLIILFILFFPFFLLLKKTEAAYYRLEPSTVTANVGGTFTVDIYVETGTDEIRGADVYLTFNGAVIEGQTVTPGDLFPTVTNNITTGSVYVVGIFDDVTSKSGGGKIASVTFKGLTNGQTTIGFDCDRSVITKADANASNILVCNDNRTTAVTVGTGEGGTYTNTTPSQTPPQSLPTSGITDKMVSWSSLGFYLLLIGGVIKLILR